MWIGANLCSFSDGSNNNIRLYGSGRGQSVTASTAIPVWADTLAALTNFIIAVVAGYEVNNSELLGWGTKLVCGIIKIN